MEAKKLVKTFQRALARYNLYFYAWLFRWLPYGLVKIFMQGLVFLGYHVTIRQRRIAEESMRIAFGREKTEKEIQDSIRQCFYNLGKGMVELIYFMSHTKLAEDKIVKIEGKEHLDKALEQGNGVIAVTAHFGNFPLMMMSLSTRGYPSNTIIRPARDEKIEKYLFDQRKKLGLNTIYAIPRQKCVTDSLKALKNNEILFIPLDQNFGNAAGVFVDFFGQKAATATGPVVFAKRSKSPILMMFILRQPDDTHKLVIHPPFELEEATDEEEMLVKNIGKMTRVIEGYIRKYPHEWGWMHRRWKSRPSKFNKGTVKK